jgi:hypothetical protein
MQEEQKDKEEPMRTLTRRVLVTLAFLAVPTVGKAKATEGIREECSGEKFDRASAGFFSGVATSARIRILPTYDEHLQFGLAEDDTGNLLVQILAVREKERGAEPPSGKTCPPLVLREQKIPASSEIRHLYDELHQLRAQVLFPDILYLDSTVYHLRLSNSKNTAEFCWLGLDEPRNHRLYPLSGWIARLRRALR